MLDISSEDRNSAFEAELKNALDEVVSHMKDVGSHTDRKNEVIVQENDTSSQNPSVLKSHVLHCSTIYAVSRCLPRLAAPGKFKDIAFGTDATHVSSSSTEQYNAYCSMTGAVFAVDASRKNLVRFDICEKISKGMTEMKFSIEYTWLCIDIHVVDADVPILICIEDMDRIGAYFSNLTNRLCRPESHHSVSIKRLNVHPFLYWGPVSHCNLSTVELQRLHCPFGHHAAAKLANAISRTGQDQTLRDQESAFGI